MSDDEKRYAPPATEVADVGTGGPRKPPAQVVWAVRLLWASLAVSVLASFIVPQSAEGGAAAAAVGLVIQWGLLAFSGWLNVCIWRQKNWARIVYLVLFLLGLVLMAVIRVPEGTPMIESILNVASTLLDAVAMYLVFVNGFRLVQDGGLAACCRQPGTGRR